MSTIQLVLERHFYSTFVSASLLCCLGEACYFQFFKATIDCNLYGSTTLSLRLSLVVFELWSVRLWQTVITWRLVLVKRTAVDSSSISQGRKPSIGTHGCGCTYYDAYLHYICSTYLKHVLLWKMYPSSYLGCWMSISGVNAFTSVYLLKADILHTDGDVEQFLLVLFSLYSFVINIIVAVSKK